MPSVVAHTHKNEAERINMKKAVIIGGGVAGLSAGILATLEGFKCDLFEKNPHPGGQLCGWKRGDYLIDNCMHWLNGTHPGDPMHATWQRLGMLCGETPLWRPQNFYESEWKGMRLSFGRDVEKTKQQMLSLSPIDRKETEKLCDTVAHIGRTMTSGMLPTPERWLRLPDTGLAYAKAVLRYGRMTVGELSECFCHPLLRAALSDFIGRPFSALAWIMAYAAFTAGDADLPAGGSVKAAERMTNRFVSVGGQLHTSSPVRRVLFDGGRAIGVMTEAGEVFEADCVVCATDPAVTFGRLLPRSFMPPRLASAYDRPAANMRYSAIHAAFACPIGCAPAGGTLIFDIPSGVPSPAGLAEDAAAMTSPPQGRLAVKCYPAERGFAPEGMCVLQVLQFLPYDRACAWTAQRSDPETYREAKRRFGLMAMQAIERRFSVSGRLRLLDVWTPATYERYTAAVNGDFLGFVLSPKNLLYRLPVRVPGLSNVYLATQWHRAPGGLPVAAQAGKRAAEAMAADAMPRRVPAARTPVQGRP